MKWIKQITLMAGLTVVYLLVIVSISYLSRYNANKPPVLSFAFTKIDPNNTCSKYIDRMKRYDAIIKASPIPVYVMSYSDLPKFLSRDESSLGFFRKGYKFCGWPSEFIFIEENAGPAYILSTYFHELQHYICVSSNCICSKEKINPYFLREEHAMMGELRMSMKNKEPEAVIASKHYISCRKNIVGDDPYKKAAKNVKDNIIWFKSRVYLEGIPVK